MELGSVKHSAEKMVKVKERKQQFAWYGFAPARRTRLLLVKSESTRLWIHLKNEGGIGRIKGRKAVQVYCIGFARWIRIPYGRKERSVNRRRKQWRPCWKIMRVVKILYPPGILLPGNSSFSLPSLLVSIPAQGLKIQPLAPEPERPY